MYKITRWALGGLKNPISWYPWLTTFIWLTLGMALLITILFYTTNTRDLHRRKQVSYYLILLGVGIFLQSLMIVLMIAKNLDEAAIAPNYISCMFIHMVLLTLLYVFFSCITVMAFPNKKDAMLPILSNKPFFYAISIALGLWVIIPLIL